KVTSAIDSKHEWFNITTEPADATIEPGKTVRFNVIAALDSAKLAKIPPMTEETAVVRFVPDDDESLSYRTETFCTAPLPKESRRMVMYTPAELVKLKAQGTAV